MADSPIKDVVVAMDKASFSISFVGVWEKQLDVLPNFDNKFAKDLFGQPYDTFCGFTPEGFAVAVENKPFPMIIIGPTRLVVKAKDKENLLEYMGKIKPEIDKKVSCHRFSSYGINSEYQWTDIGEGESPEVWLWNHFLNPSLSCSSQVKMCSKLNLRIGLDENQVANIEIEPRRGIRNGIFANINHHHNEELDELPTGEYAENMINNSIKAIQDKIISKLIENDYEGTKHDDQQ